MNTKSHTANGLLIGLIALAVGGTPAALGRDPSPNSKPPHFYGQVKAYCIGIDKYQADGIPALSSAEAEAKAISETLRHQFGYSTTPLIGPEATKANIERILQESATLTKNDALIVYFGGHGEVVVSDDGTTRTGFLIPFDAKLNMNSRLRAVYSLLEFREQAIDMRAFADRLKALPVGHVVLIADACHSGVLAKRGGTESQVLETVLTSPSRTVITSAAQHESARDGLFSVQLNKQLVKAATNQMATSTDTLFRALYDDTISGQKVVKQIPQIAWFGDDDGRFVFFPLQISDAEISDLKQRLATKRLTFDPTPGVRGIQSDLKRAAGVRLKPKLVAEAMTAGNYWYGSNTEEERKRWQGKRDAFLEAAKFGDHMGLAGLFFCTKRGFGGNTNPFAAGVPNEVVSRLANDAFAIALQAADADDREGYGKFLLGLCYLDGIGTSKRESVGLRLIDQSAALNNPLAFMHKMSRPPTTAATPQDKLPATQQALRFAKVLHDLDIPMGMRVLAQAYHVGLGGYEKDAAQVERLLTRAAGTGDPESLLALALFVSQKDIERARTLLQAAADTGDAAALLFLANECWQNEGDKTRFGLERDRAKAARLYRDACDQDYAPAFVPAVRALSTPGPLADSKVVRKLLDRGKELKMAECYAAEAGCIALARADFTGKEIDLAIASMHRAIELGWPDGDLVFELHSIKEGVPNNEGTVESFHWTMLAYKNCTAATPQPIKDKNLKRLQRHPMWLKENGVYEVWMNKYPETFAEYKKLYNIK